MKILGNALRVLAATRQLLQGITNQLESHQDKGLHPPWGLNGMAENKDDFIENMVLNHMKQCSYIIKLIELHILL